MVLQIEDSHFFLTHGPSGIKKVERSDTTNRQMITFSSCDKSVPAHLMAIARLNIPAIHFCGGSMMPGPGFTTAVKCYETMELVDKGEMTPQRSLFYQVNACSTCGACQYMNTVVCRRRSWNHAGHQGFSPSGCINCDRQNRGRQSG